MSRGPNRCPTSADLERAFWNRDADVRAHVEGCAQCRPHWDDIAALASACSDLAAEPAPESGRRTQIRADLLAREIDTREVHWAARLRPLAPLASAAAVALVFALWPARSPERTAPPQGADVLAHGDARYMRIGAPPDEAVRLVEGTLTVAVDLKRSERFRVLTGNAEIAIDTAGPSDAASGDGALTSGAFDVTAADDRLVAIRVVRGGVEVRADRHEVSVVPAGNTWTAPDVDQPAANDPPTPTPTTAGPATPIAPEPTPSLAPAREVTSSTEPPRRTTRAPRSPGAAAPAPMVEESEAAVQATTTDAGAPAAAPTRRAGRELFSQGWELLRDGQFLAAADTLDHAALLAPSPGDGEDARFWRAVALARAGAAGRAVQAFAHFLDRYPKSVHAANASVMLGWLLLERGAYDEAERRFHAGAEDPDQRVRQSAAKGLRAIERARPLDRRDQ